MEFPAVPSPVPADQLLATTQGDILSGGIPKKNESFVFFGIQDPDLFCRKLAFATLMGLFSSGKSVVTRRKYIKAAKLAAKENLATLPGELHMAMAQISFSAAGLERMQEALPANSLGLTDSWKERDAAFFDGMELDASRAGTEGLGDAMERWEPGFKGRRIHGLFLIAGSNKTSIQELMVNILLTFGSSVSIVKIETGEVRQGEFKDREHFGFNDGVSQPTVEGFPEDNPKIPDGKVGELGDKWNTFPQDVFIVQDGGKEGRPKWAQHGSFLVFRKLEQDVKKWNDDIFANAQQRNMSPELLAAKLIGRWPSGCPVMVNTERDDKTQGFHNQFDYISIPRENGAHAICPGGSHIRKMNPHRAVPHDGSNRPDPDGRIIRRGITYGTDYNDGKGAGDRGLHFVCYQSSIEYGFRNIQIFWSNSQEFPVNSAGVDLLMGNQPAEGASKMYVADDDGNKNGSHFEWKGINPYVKPRGGEYFFTPSFTALKETLSISSLAANDVLFLLS